MLLFLWFLKVFCLLIGVWFTAIHTYKAMLRSPVDGVWVVVQAVAITAFITLQWLT